MSVPSHQKALFLEAKQGQWAVRTTEVRKPGSGDIVVKVEAAALGGVEWKIQAWGILIKDYPAILGMDGAGTVVELGEGVTTFAVGDRVMFQGNWDILTGTIYGTFLQYFTAPAQFVAKADYALSAKYFAPWLPGGRGKYAGKPIVILGGPTSHGQYATQFAHLSGFSPIITTASLHNADLLKSFGATHVLDRKLPAEEIRARVSEIAGGPVGLVYDTVSVSATFPLAVALAAPGSTVLTVQWAPEELVAQAMKDGKAVHMVLGFYNAPVNREIGATLLASLPELLESGDIKVGERLEFGVCK
ncbi:GroES-like protein [Dichomitus squalens]|uniref:GroES-like protein n=1 Tax=Dichomitus squalens TaxID=114155 RepID=A0A4Q9MFK1_9APHY|nr:GroES-like protein [Dichomitus squalens]